MGNSDLKFMRRALFLAENRAKYASPNPKVGAVLVRKGRIVGEGSTQPYGGAHAEVMALRQAGPRARGSTLYVTLEPCGHFGKTPPCAGALVKAGVRKVVAAMEDPFPLVRGRGFKTLKSSGVSVTAGLLEKEARELNFPFLRAVALGRPWVILKAAVSVDGKSVPPPGGSPWITGLRARRKVHELRSQVDAILVGRGTVLADDPSLTVRLPGYRRGDGWPLRVVLDSGLKIPLDAELFKGRSKTVLFTSPGASLSREKALKRKGIPVFRVPLLKKMLSLRAVLKTLNSLQVRTVLVEGGGTVHSSFFREHRVDEWALFLSPRRLGPRAGDWMGQGGLSGVLTAPGLKKAALRQVGGDFLLRAKMSDSDF